MVLTGAAGLAGGHRYRPVRPVVGYELVRGQAQLLNAPQFEGLDPEALLGAGQLVAVHGVGEVRQFAGQRVVGGAYFLQFEVQPVPALLRGVPFLAGEFHGDVDESGRVVHGGRDGGSTVRLDAPAAGPFGRFLPCPALGGRRPVEGGSPVACRGELLLGAAQGQPGLHLGGPGNRCGQGQGVAVLMGRFLFGRRLLGRGQPGRDGCKVILPRADVGPGLRQGRGQAFAFRHGTAQHGVQVAQAFGHRGELRVGVMEFFQGRVCPVLGLGTPGFRGGQGEAVPFDPGRDRGELR